MKKILSLLIAAIFSLSISAFALAEVKPAPDTNTPKVEGQKAAPAAKKKVVKKKVASKKKTTKKAAPKQATEKPVENK